MKNGWQLMIAGVIGLLAAGVIMLINSTPRGEPLALSPPPSPAPLTVHVEGAVQNPGLYTLPASSRVQDAIDAAGGLLPEAAPGSLNLAAPLADGEKVLVPYQPELAPPGAPQPESAIAQPTGVTFPIDLNTATLEELEALPNIGPTKAQAILDYRQENGPFTAIEQVQNVSGIGPSTFETIRDLITITDD